MKCNLSIKSKDATWHGGKLMQAYKHTYGDASGCKDGLKHELGSSS